MQAGRAVAAGTPAGCADRRAPCRRLRHRGALCHDRRRAGCAAARACCHDAALMLALVRGGSRERAQRGALQFVEFPGGESNASIWRSRAAARTAPSPGACSIACSRTRRSTSPGSARTSAGAVNAVAAGRGPRRRRPRRRARQARGRVGGGGQGRRARSAAQQSLARRHQPLAARWRRWRACSRPTTSIRWASIPSASCSRRTSISRCCAPAPGPSC